MKLIFVAISTMHFVHVYADEILHNLNEIARNSGPVCGRQTEIRNLSKILTTKTKPYAMLIGPAGVGKTSVVEGVAQMIERSKNDRKIKVPKVLEGATIFEVDTAKLNESSLHQIVRKTIQKNGILFVDEAHILDQKKLLGPFRDAMEEGGGLKLIMATTIEEYKKYIEPFGNFSRFVQLLNIEEPSVEETIRILKAIRGKIEMYYNVNISDHAIETATKLTTRYISDKFNPDKSIDVIEYAASKMKLEQQQEKTFAHILAEERIAVLESEKKALKRVNCQNLTKSEDINRVISLDKIKASLADARQKLKNDFVKSKDLGKVQIKQAIAYKSQIPVDQMGIDDAEIIRGIRQELANQVIGQIEAVNEVSKTLIRSKSGMGNPNQPIGSFLFCGGTGTGKTEMAKAIAKSVMGGEDALKIFDMSEYQDKSSLYSLIGTPPGYYGSDKGGKLTETVRRNPYSVILLDEIEKADKDIGNILLQILDEGRLTDSMGVTVNFKNTIVILTSNLGANFIYEGTLKGKALNKAIEKVLIKELKREIINRIDHVIKFKPLKDKSMTFICKLLLKDIEKRAGLNDKGARLVFRDSIVATLKDVKRAKSDLEGEEKNESSESSDIKTINNDGARPLRRNIERTLVSFLSSLILGGYVPMRSTIILYSDHKESEGAPEGASAVYSSGNFKAAIVEKK